MNSFSLRLGAAVCAGFVLAGCQQAQEAKNSYSAIVASTQAVKEMGKNLDAAQERQKQRRERGDTLAIGYKELQKYLPASPAGYAPSGTPEGENMNMPQAHFSSASQQYLLGDKTLKVALVDYNAAAPLFMASTAMMNSGLSMEDDSQLLRGVDLGLPNTKGIETLDKKDHKATVVLGVADRFLVTVEASGQDDIKMVEDVAKNLNLKEMAKL